LIEPIVYSSKGDSLSLSTAGFICGFLWEFWNYWAPSKWIYTAPFMQELKIFEMPVAGFLGFGPFAWEYFVMYSFAWLLLRRNLDK
jgi:hypothetical protein